MLLRISVLVGLFWADQQAIRSTVVPNDLILLLVDDIDLPRSDPDLPG
jgi:hypothetical protein